MPPDRSINAITLPTNTANANVLRTHGSIRSVAKSLKVVSSEAKRAKPLRRNAPNKIPPKSEKRTLLVVNAKTTARSEGRRERAESSMLKLDGEQH